MFNSAADGQVKAKSNNKANQTLTNEKGPLQAVV